MFIGVDDSHDSVAAHVSSLPYELLIDILSRLPGKSLMRFKSVSKHWLSLIREDAHLMDLHFSRSKSRPVLLHINPLPEVGLSTSNTVQQRISCGEISGGEEQVEEITSEVRITDDKWFLYDHILEPVNGLVCFVHWKTYAIRVYNASTRQETPWVKSTLLAEENCKLTYKDSKMKIKSLRNPVYRFGFDPEYKEHKVFCFWRLVSRPQRRHNNSLDRPDYESWEALTVGQDTKWRRINAVPNKNNQIEIKQALPPASCSRRQVYADGTIYWSNKEYRSDAFRYSNPDDPDVIVAFDVGSEKYRVIPVPKFILDEPRDETFRVPIGMLVLGTHVALLYRMEPNVVKLWMLDDGADKKLENCGRESNTNWRSETITLPFCCDNGFDGFGIAGCSDKILFESRVRKNSELFTCLYSYDRVKKSCKKIEMDGVSSFTSYSDASLLATFTESLFPVQPLDKTS
ncbi:hypothetical protein MKW94_016649 [Papaver nudicaule]|uniref:F-box domain-containing protein n=1 Tax=Papaver nudicaule TaxID=74823 RepID=A0AA41VGI5_PAPNU|nr:hypothetical protein [Papaver nudicaule]